MSQKRVKRVQKALQGWGVDALIIKDPVDIYYLTGSHVTVGTVVVTKTKSTLIVDNRYFEKCQKETFMPVVLQAEGAVVKQLDKASAVGFSQESLTYGSYIALQKEGIKNLVPLEHPMQEIRAIKEASEVKKLEKAISLCYKGFDFVLENLRTGVSEKQIAKGLECFWLANGGDALSFESIIAFGKNSSMPHYRSQDAPLTPGDIVLVDIGVVVDGYASDMTRTFFYGKPHPKLSKIYDIVLDAQKKSIKAAKPNMSAASLYEVSKKVITKAGFEKQYLHGLGHGIGLETHECPYLRPTSKSSILTPGVCITIEPGIYIQDLGGVRIEDMILITKDGSRTLTSEYPKEKQIVKAIS